MLQFQHYERVQFHQANEQITQLQSETRGGYNWPRTWNDLLGRDMRVRNERVPKLMRLLCIRAKDRRRCKVNTDGNHNLPIAQNRPN